MLWCIFYFFHFINVRFTAAQKASQSSLPIRVPSLTYLGDSSLLVPAVPLDYGGVGLYQSYVPHSMLNLSASGGGSIHPTHNDVYVILYDNNRVPGLPGISPTPSSVSVGPDPSKDPFFSELLTSEPSGTDLPSFQHVHQSSQVGGGGGSKFLCLFYTQVIRDILGFVSFRCDFLFHSVSFAILKDSQVII